MYIPLLQCSTFTIPFCRTFRTKGTRPDRRYQGLVFEMILSNETCPFRPMKRKESENMNKGGRDMYKVPTLCMHIWIQSTQDMGQVCRSLQRILSDRVQRRKIYKLHLMLKAIQRCEHDVANLQDLHKYLQPIMFSFVISLTSTVSTKYVVFLWWYPPMHISHQ